MTQILDVKECVNEVCPWSGKPVSADALTRYRGAIVGFCNTGCRDKFETATRAFDAVIDAADGAAKRGDA